MHTRARRFLAGVVLVLATAGCGGGLGNLGALGDILAGGAAGAGGQQGQQGQIAGEIQGVDSGRQLIQLRTDDGRNGSLYYDQNTVVVFQQQQYPVNALERGDLVVITAQQDAQGNLYAGRVDVRQSVQQRTGQGATGGELRQFAGQVGGIDYDRGLFELRSQYGGTLTVALPYNPAAATVDRFRRLRAGDAVQIEGTLIGDNRVELSRFR